MNDHAGTTMTLAYSRESVGLAEFPSHLASPVPASLTSDDERNLMRRTWVKLYVDQCLRGSMIAELSPTQRWMFVGLILLAGDSPVPGIVYRRKNEDGIPIGYSDSVLADTLGVDESDIQPGLFRMVEKSKISVDSLGVITVSNWGKYQSEYERTRNSPSRVVQKYGVDVDRDVDVDVDKKFIEFWSAYPSEGRLAKKESRIKFGAIYKRGELPQLTQGFRGYLEFLKHKRLVENFEMRPMYAKTFLNGRWQEFVDFKFKAAL
jgi:hypothetical protein